MKKFFKFIGILLLLLIAIVLIGGLFTSKKYQYEKSIEISTSKEKVWNHISTLHEMTQWMPWMKMDPQMHTSMSGTDGNVGAVYSWKGNKNVGEGSMTLTHLDPENTVDIDLLFKNGFESKAKTALILKGVGNRTIVTWTMDSEMPYPFNFIAQTCMNMDKMMDKDFGTGLQNLKKMVENQH